MITKQIAGHTFDGGSVTLHWTQAQTSPFLDYDNSIKVCKAIPLNHIL